jgi:hypothetical protein
MKVAICFWGLNRSIEYTLESLETHLFKVLRDAGIEYRIFLHALTLSRMYSNPRANEHNVFLKQTTWKLLMPHYSTSEPQDDVDKQLHLKEYRKHGDAWQHESVPGYIPFSCLDNCIRSLYSLDQVTTLWETCGERFDAVMYLRPDVRLITSFNVQWLESLQPKKIYCPNFHLIHGCNDRFGLGVPKEMSIYGHRFRTLHKYSEQQPIHSERYLAHVMKQHHIQLEPVPFRFWRVRAGGKVHEEDAKSL